MMQRFSSLWKVRGGLLPIVAACALAASVSADDSEDASTLAMWRWTDMSATNLARDVWDAQSGRLSNSVATTAQGWLFRTGSISPVGGLIYTASQHTVECVFRCTNATGNVALYGEGEQITANPYILYGLGGGTNIFENIRDDTGAISPVARGTNNVADGRWHHVAYVRDGTNYLNYLDGMFHTRAAFAGTQTALTTRRIGSMQRTAEQFYFNGEIAWMRITRRALNAGEIAERAARGPLE